MIPLSPADSAPLYVEMMGGADPILTKGRELYEGGKYREAQEIVNKLVYAQPENVEAKKLLADIFEQIGYQQESSSVRNSFLAAAFELRSGIPEGMPPSSASPDLLGAITTEMLFDSLAIRMDSLQVEDVAFVANISHPDTGEMLVLELSNATLTTQVGFAAPKPTFSVATDRADFGALMSGRVTLSDLVLQNRATVEGDTSGLERLMGAHRVQSPLRDDAWHSSGTTTITDCAFGSCGRTGAVAQPLHLAVTH